MRRRVFRVVVRLLGFDPSTAMFDPGAAMATVNQRADEYMAR